MPKKSFTERRIAPPSVVPRLKELTTELTREPTTRVFRTERGDSVVRSLLSRDVVGVVDAGILEGDTFPFHVHDDGVVECLMVYQGIAAVEYKDGHSVKVDEGGVIVLRPGELHQVSALDGYGNVRLIGITVPKDKGYPGDTRRHSVG